MNYHCGHEHRHDRHDDARDGHAAEDFARRIARDAQRFGERIAEHAAEFARETAREFRHGRSLDPTLVADDVRGVLKDVRGLVTDVIDGVDELLARFFPPEPADAPADAPAEDVWARVVTNREVPCVACGRAIGAGEECHLHRRRDGRDFRCAECGPPAPAARGPETPPGGPAPSA